MNFKSKYCPWLNHYVWQWIKLKRKYRKKLKSDPHNEYLKSMFIYVCKKTDNAKKKCKKEFYGNLLENTSHAKLWKNLNTIMGRYKAETCIELNIDGRKTSSISEVCDIFNNFFTQIGTNLASKISISNLNPLSNVKRVGRSIFLRPTNANEVIDIIKELNAKKSCGPDNFPACVFKNNATTFSYIIVDLFNKMLQQGVFPDCLKIAKVIPVYKSGDASDPSNFRPISTLSTFSKIFEKLLVNRFISFINQNNILYKYQYGFRKGCSTTTATVELVEFLLSKIDSKCIVGGLFLDLKKAFDKLTHRILLQKLECYGFRGLANDIIKSYLTDRQQFVAIDGCRSSLQTVNVGVPQGSTAIISNLHQ